MLQRLFIKNIALIDSLEIDFSKGLNILTGETGAGKSIIVDAINIALGGRISKDLIRSGQESALVEAFFKIENKSAQDFIEKNELVDEDISELILSREFNIKGKNICRINGRAVSVSMLKELGRLLVDIHGQHENQSLLDVSSHIDLLDNFGGEKILEIKNEYTRIYTQIKSIEKKVSELGGNQERERKLDLLKYQLDEINAAKLQIGEDDELETKKNLMNNAGKIVSSIEEVYDILYLGNKRNSILDGLNIVLKELSSIQKFDGKVSNFVSEIENIYYMIEDITSEIRQYKETLEFNPKLLEEIEERLDLIFKLKRKYGSTIKEILEYRDSLVNEIGELEGSWERLEEYNRQLEVLNDELNKKAVELSNMRKCVAEELENKIVKELEDLEMKRTQFKVNFETDGDTIKYTPKGIDKVEFLISPNVGEQLKPLSKIASGGEMSRIMLAIKTILAKIDEIPTLIFDEIDAGISGKIAQMVGQKLSYISHSHQVLCITHLPQIAAMADAHYLIEKYIQENTTKIRVKKLNFEEKKQEIARILGGAKITQTTLKHAQEMLEHAQQKN